MSSSTPAGKCTSRPASCSAECSRFWLKWSFMLPRILEPEVMDTPQEALDYDTMDHSTVNRVFVDDLLAVRPQPGDVLDLGTGTALIPVDLCKRETTCRVMAVDAAVNMLELARYNTGTTERIQLAKVD